MSEAVDHPFAIVPARMLNEVKATSVVVYAVLAEHTNADQECWPSVSRIAARAGVTTGTVRSACKELEDAGWLTVRGRATDEGRQTSNLYKIRRVRNSDTAPPQKTGGSPLKKRKGAPSKNVTRTRPKELDPSTTSGCVDCGAAVTTDPATKQPNPRCKLCHASAKPGRAPAARRPVGPAYERYVADNPEGVVDAASTLSAARRALRCET